MIKVKFPSMFQPSMTDNNECVEWGGIKWRGLDLPKGREVIRYPASFEDLVYFYPLVINILEKVKKIRLGSYISVTVPTELIKNNEIISTIRKRILNHNQKIAEVYPQGVYALFQMVHSGKAQLTDTLIIDGGFNTVNVSVVKTSTASDNVDLNVVFMRTYVNEGIRSLLNLFYEEARKKVINLTSNDALLKEIFLRGGVVMGVNYFDLQKEKQSAIVLYSQMLFERIKSELNSVNAFYNQILIVGGLAYYVDIESPTLSIIKGDEFSNAEGLFNYTGRPVVDFGFGDVKVVYNNS